MPIKDILLPLVGEPSAAAIAAIDKCVAVAGDVGARVTAVAIEEEIVVRPKVTISDDLDNSAAVEAVRSVSDAHGLLKVFDAAATRFAVRNEQKLSRFAAADIAANIAVCARLRDLSIVPVKPDDDRSEKLVERLISESGRPILMCPEELASDLAVVFDKVVIAWDHTARAVAQSGCRPGRFPASDRCQAFSGRGGFGADRRGRTVGADHRQEREGARIAAV